LKQRSGGTILLFQSRITGGRAAIPDGNKLEFNKTRLPLAGATERDKRFEPETIQVDDEGTRSSPGRSFHSG
jgi:hypothetical protein